MNRQQFFFVDFSDDASAKLRNFVCHYVIANLFISNICFRKTKKNFENEKKTQVKKFWKVKKSHAEREAEVKFLAYLSAS